MEYLYYIATYLVLLNIVTTYRLIKSEDYEVSQKLIQFILLWILPLLGTLVVTFFLNQEPIVLSEKMSKFRIILKILLFTWFIKVVFQRKNNSLHGVSNEGHGAEVNDIRIYENSGSMGEGGGSE